LSKEEKWTFTDGKIISPTGKTWPAKSGPWGRGSAPKGEYTIGETTGLPSIQETEPYTDKTGNSWFTPIEPTFQTNRTSLGVHPDGNVPGTEGCIGATEKDTSSLKEALKRARGKKIVVK